MGDPFAFPVSTIDGFTQHGMELRDWFAGQCDTSAYDPLESYVRARGVTPTIAQLADYIAEIRLIEADAMLAARTPTATDAVPASGTR